MQARQARYRAAGAVLTMLLAAGCSSTPQYSQADIDRAADSGKLPALYHEIDATRRAAREGSDQAAALKTLQGEVAAKITAPDVAAVRGALDAAEHAAQPLSLQQLSDLDTRVEQIRRWQPATADQLAAQLHAARATTLAAAAKLTARLDALAASSVAERYRTLVELAVLKGGSQGKALRAQAKAELASAYQTARTALAAKELDRAGALFDQIAAVAPDYQGLESSRQQVVTGRFEQQFWQALVDGRPEQAYALFHDFAETPAFARHGKKIGKDAADLADYFDALGDKRRQENDWVKAFAAFSRVVYIRRKVGITDQPANGLARFLSAVDSRVQQARKNDQPSQALAWLEVIRALQPDYPPLLKAMRPVHEAVLEHAVVKLSIEPFASTDALSGYGGMVASSISQYLLTTMPDHVRVIARDELRSLSRSQLAADATSQSYYLIDGRVLKGTVDTSSSPRVEQRRVQTGTEEAANPDYTRWRDLPRSQRKQTPQPPKRADQPVFGQVPLHLTDVVKNGSMAVSYRVIDPASAKVLQVETVNDNASYSGVARAAVDVDSYHRDAASADVPDDSAVLQALAASIAEKIGRQLAARVESIEQRYAAEAGRYSAEGNAIPALRKLSYAVVVADDDSENRAALIQQLRAAVLALPHKS